MSEPPMEPVLTIGASMQIKGELTVTQDLVIESTVEGKVIVDGHGVVVGAGGHAVADIQAKTVVVDGRVVGDITAARRIEVSASGFVQGNLRAPRVILADGARVNGKVSMEMTSPAVTRCA